MSEREETLAVWTWRVCSTGRLHEIRSCGTKWKFGWLSVATQTGHSSFPSRLASAMGPCISRISGHVQFVNNTNCCGASVASEQQHNQDLSRIYKREYEFSNSSLFTRMHCTEPECTAPLFTRVLRDELHEDVTPSSRVDSSEKSLMVVMFCSDLLVKRCEEDLAWLS